MTPTKGLPRDADGFVITSADFGVLYLVEIVYNTDPSGKRVADDDDSNRTLHGPFADLVEAHEWMNAYPDDTDVRDMTTLVLNAVRP